MTRLKMLGVAAALAGGLAAASAAQAGPAFDAGLTAAGAAEATRVQYYGPRAYGGPRYGETYQHYQYRQAHRDYRRARRAYRAERYYRYGY